MRRVAVIHPDLGVGGAERLIVDASKALQECGHQVTVYTGYHDPKRCFKETRDGTLKTVELGRWIPRTLFGKFHALMAYSKMIYIALYLLLFSEYDVILCDQVSACIPFIKLKFWNAPKVVFYCHFPDQLLTHRESVLKSMYRIPIDLFEEWSTSLADVILVNSNFTQNIVERTFRSLRDRELTVLYPCVDVNTFIERKPSSQNCDDYIEKLGHGNISTSKFIYLSLNRFERKKKLCTAIKAFSSCLTKCRDANFKKTGKKLGLHLVIAGGYDNRLDDSVRYYRELKQLTDKLKLYGHVTFIESPSDDDKMMLLHLCDAVVYTPENEHFGIVPLEAMAMSKPVVASASGGPLETIVDGVNGYLCSDPSKSIGKNDMTFEDAMLKLYVDEFRSNSMGAKGLKRVRELFSYETFRERLKELCSP